MKISVITVCYNAEATIASTLSSVAAQQDAEVEHIVIDGGSRDGTMAVVARYPHVDVVVSEPDRGIYDAMNKGIARATGDAIGFLNADDYFCRDNALDLIGQHLQSADVVMGDLVIIDSGSGRPRRFYSSRAFSPWMLRFGYMPPHPTIYAKREVFDRLGGFNSDFRIAGDFDFVARLMFGEKGVRWQRVPHTLVAFRTGGASTRNLSAKLQMNREILRSLRDLQRSWGMTALYARYPFKVLQMVLPGWKAAAWRKSG